MKHKGSNDFNSIIVYFCKARLRCIESSQAKAEVAVHFQRVAPELELCKVLPVQLVKCVERANFVLYR